MKIIIFAVILTRDKLHFKDTRYASLLRKTLFVFLFSAYLFPLRAQKVFSSYPFQFDQLFSLPNITDPSASLDDQQHLLQVGYNGFNLLSNDLSTYYLNARFIPGRDSVTKPHILGLFIVNDKEGAYLNRFRLMGQYSFGVVLSERLRWTTGLSLGFVNNSLKPNAAVGGESAFSADGDIGTRLTHARWYAGLSLNQIFQNHIRFLNGTYFRPRYVNVMAGYQIPVSLFMKIKFEFSVRTGAELYNKYTGGLTIIYQEKLLAGLVAKSSNGLIPMLGIQGIPLLKQKFCFRFSFRIPTSKFILPGTGNTEIMAEYKF